MFVQVRLSSTEIGPKATNFGLYATMIEPKSTTLCRHRQHLGQMRPSCCRCRPGLGRIRPDLDRMRPTLWHIRPRAQQHRWTGKTSRVHHSGVPEIVWHNLGLQLPNRAGRGEGGWRGGRAGEWRAGVDVRFARTVSAIGAGLRPILGSRPFRPTQGILTELLKQKQFVPMTTAEIIVSLWSGTRGHSCGGRACYSAIFHKLHHVCTCCCRPRGLAPGGGVAPGALN